MTTQNETPQPWTLEYHDKIMTSFHDGIHYETQGYYQLKYNGNMYGLFSKDSFDNQKTGYILEMITRIANDAHHLANRDYEPPHTFD